MSKKAKRILFISGLTIDVGITIFLFVVSIIMLATMPSTKISNAAFEEQAMQNGPFIGFLQTHSTVYLVSCVIPLFLLLAFNIIFLILYVRKLSKKPEVTVDDLNEEQKAALRAELLKELQCESKEPKKEEKSE